MSTEAAYELVRQHNRYHCADDDTCPFCAFERCQRQGRTMIMDRYQRDCTTWVQKNRHQFDDKMRYKGRAADSPYAVDAGSEPLPVDPDTLGNP